MVIRRFETWSPLTKLASTKVLWKWIKVEQEAFVKLKMAMSEKTLLNYTSFSKEFDIHTNTNNKQLGAVISQDERPVAFYSRRVTIAQEKHTITEKDLLAIV